MYQGIVSMIKSNVAAFFPPLVKKMSLLKHGYSFPPSRNDSDLGSAIFRTRQCYTARVFQF